MKAEKKTHRYELYRADREKGMTYQQIADKYGVSRQCVSHACGKGNPKYFHAVTEDCVYPNIRRWMNENRVSKAEFVRRLGRVPYGQQIAYIGAYLKGKHDPPKRIIDKMIEVTGMTYEELFYREESPWEKPE